MQGIEASVSTAVVRCIRLPWTLYIYLHSRGFSKHYCGKICDSVDTIIMIIPGISKHCCGKMYDWTYTCRVYIEASVSTAVVRCATGHYNYTCRV